jgi:hypothetical protein
MAYNFDTPEGRLAAIEALGPTAYNAAMAQHRAASAVATVNGYPIRPMASRFGQLFEVVGAGAAFTTQKAAEGHAAGLPANAS